MDPEQSPYTRRPRPQDRPAGSSAVSAPAGTAAAAAVLVFFVAATQLLPRLLPSEAPKFEQPVSQAPAAAAHIEMPIHSAAGSGRTLSSPAPIGPENLADKAGPRIAAPHPAQAGGTTMTQTPVRESILGRDNAGFVPWANEKGSARQPAHSNGNIASGAVNGMAAGAGMGAAVTDCDQVKLAAARPGLNSMHYRTSGAAYGPSVAGYAPSAPAAHYVPPTVVFGSGLVFGAPAPAPKQTGVSFGSSGAAYGSSGAGYGSSGAGYGSSGAGYGASTVAPPNCGQCAK
jgi:hypothetical protein